jgi:hypothetical protein
VKKKKATKTKQSGKKGAAKKPAAKAKAKATKKAAPKKKAASKPRKKAGSPKKKAPKASAKWPKFVEKHGVVLASAKGPVPSVAEAIAGEPIVKSWWSHPKSQQIFDALSTIDDDDDIRCFKLVDHKITFVHKRLWPALAKLAQAGVLDAERVASIQQEHMPTGEHRNITTPYPDWVPEDVAVSAESISVDDAKTALGAWLNS